MHLPFAIPLSLKRSRIDFFMWALFFLAAILIFTRLGSVYLWEDEAETALVAKTIWTNGLPKITDGVNYFCEAEGKRMGFGDIWAWTPWLQFYLASASLKLFGSNAWAARLPFAITGFLAFPLFFKLLKQIFDVRTARLATLFLVSSVPTLLLIRQCRYYSLVLFTTLWAIHALHGMEQGRKHGAISLFGALFFLFHSNYMLSFGIWFSTLAYALFPSIARPLRMKVFWVLISVALLNGPWFFLFKPLHTQPQVVNGQVIFERFLFSLEGLNHYVAPILLLPLAVFGMRYLSDGVPHYTLSVGKKRWVAFFFILICLTVAFALFGPAQVFRYLVGIIPITLLLLTLVLVRLLEKSKLIGGIVIGLIIFSNFFNVLFYPVMIGVSPSLAKRFAWKFESPFILYLGELIHPPHGPLRALVKYLKDHSSPSDLVIVTYGELPIIFYTGLRVVGGISFEALKEARNADWVIPRKLVALDKDARVMVYLLDNLPWDRYEKIDLSETDFPWENIPEPSAHQFRTLKLEADWNVQIYRKLSLEEPSRMADPPNLFYFTPTHRVIEGTQNFRREVIRYLLLLKEPLPK